MKLSDFDSSVLSKRPHTVAEDLLPSSGTMGTIVV